MALFRMLASFASVVFFVSTVQATTAHAPRGKANTCVIEANGNGSDDAPAIRAAFSKCKRDGHIIFEDKKYYVNSPLNTTDLSNVDIDLHGYLLWSNDTSYWLKNSMPIGYQNQSTVWFLGGHNLHVNGFGMGTFDGNGQAWYDIVKGVSNYPDRPMGLTIQGAVDSSFVGLNFVQSQMWTMTIMHSDNVLMEDIYVNSTSHNGNPARNTDGADTMFSNNIVMRRWRVDNGDDAISLKANSTNIVVEDSIFMTGQGFALGSIGQYVGKFETIENVTVRNITTIGTKYAAYVKTWTGNQVDYPPNGGGGGLGFIRNVSIQDLKLKGVRDVAVNIGQCTSFSGAKGDCNSSLFHVGDIKFTNFTGDIAGKYIGSMQCSSAAGGCSGIEFGDIDLIKTATSTVVDDYKCSNVQGPIGFEC
ncbi:hypothetical protein JX265_001168 [Neoarthrinium moseri]|uniref:Uncharacterized protein n=1 Tax=Neoarthrinium moseri TaxID=1658444 RepID=A0A9P9WXJ0_9PEZI|nr:hypothetical protein JX266_005266 [Neoarthrinium moseri]KAI1880928.1 hypothetical protein JX265_001168 [Neoarthrinium moseri]